MTGFRRVIAKRPSYQFVGLEAVQGQQPVEGRVQNGESRGGGQVLGEMRQVCGGQSAGGTGEPLVRLVFSENMGQALG